MSIKDLYQLTIHLRIFPSSIPLQTRQLYMLYVKSLHNQPNCQRHEKSYEELLLEQARNYQLNTPQQKNENRK